MNPGVKQRIVGLVVLAAVVGVFLPMLFNLEPPPSVDTASQIPPPPGIEPTPIEQPNRPEGIQPPPPAEDLFQARELRDEPTPEADKEQPAPRLSDRGVPEAWVLQVGSFKDEEGAQSLTGRLQQAGFKAFHRTATVDGSRVHRVLVGPKVDRQRLLEEKAAIARQFDIDGLVLSFEP